MMIDIDGKIRMVDISYCRNGIKQGKRPICGIYAFLNGFYDGKIYKLCKWKKLAKELWKLSIDKNIPTDISLLSKNDVVQYSFIGEFFSSDNLENFLADISQNNINVKHELSKLTKHTITRIDIDDVEKIDWNNFSDKKGTTFYLIPINSWMKCKDKFNMHWICLKQGKRKPYILNSAGDRSGERNAMKHVIKDNRNSINRCHKLVGGISNSADLDNVVMNMQNRSKYVPFDFKEYFKGWTKSCKSRKLIDECKDRIGKISKSKACEYSFVDSEFKIVKVTYYQLR